MPRRPNPKTREKLLDAAEQIMLRKGFEAASVDDICRMSRLTKGSFFHYFESKNQVGVEAIRRFYERNREAFRSAPYQKESDPLKRVYGFLDMVIGLSSSPKFTQGCLIGTIAQEMALTDNSLRATCASCFADWAQGLKRDLDLAKAQYAPRARWETQGLAEHFIAVLQGSLILVKSSRESHTLTESLTHLKRYISMLFQPDV